MVQPLLWWTDGQLAFACDLLGRAWLQWLDDWYGQGKSGSVQCLLAQDVDDVRAKWTLLGGAGESLVWAHVVDAGVDQIRSGLFDRKLPASATLAAKLAQKAGQALRLELAALMDIQPMPDGGNVLPANVGAWSGSVVAVFSSPFLSLRLLLNAACVGSALGAARAQGAASTEVLPPVCEGLSQIRAKVKVELAGCEINLGSLQALRVGDVLRIPQALGDPMQLTIDGQSICFGYLGRRGISKAVELLPRTAGGGLPV